VTFSITSLRQQRAHLRYGISARLATPEAPGELRIRLTPYWQTRWGDDDSGASGKEDGVDSRLITIALGCGANRRRRIVLQINNFAVVAIRYSTAKLLFVINAFSWHQW
jgi:hypothetical protein